MLEIAYRLAVDDSRRVCPGVTAGLTVGILVAAAAVHRLNWRTTASLNWRSGPQSYFKFPSSAAHAWATAELAFSLPGGLAHPPFSTKLPCM
jgi:hypothetical protein